MTIPLGFGRRRVVVSLAVAVPAATGPRAFRVPAADAATDAELARLGQAAAQDVERTRWESVLLLYGHRPI